MHKKGDKGSETSIRADDVDIDVDDGDVPLNEPEAIA